MGGLVELSGKRLTYFANEASNEKPATWLNHCWFRSCNVFCRALRKLVMHCPVIVNLSAYQLRSLGMEDSPACTWNTCHPWCAVGKRNDAVTAGRQMSRHHSIHLSGSWMRFCLIKSAISTVLKQCLLVRISWKTHFWAKTFKGGEVARVANSELKPA